MITLRAFRNNRGNEVGHTLEPFTFPGGEWSIRGDVSPDATTFVIDVRGSNPDDLVRASVAANYIAKTQPELRRVLFLPYLPAARSDHDDVMGIEVYSRIVNSINVHEVMAIDPHSPASRRAFERLSVLDHTSMVIGVAQQWAGHDLGAIVAADKSGAAHIQNVPRALGVPMMQAGKNRDPQTGKLTGFSCEPVPETGKILVVDDICDGGGTFLGLADVLDVPRERLGLWITHGIFSNNALDKLSASYGFIACTDSFRTLNVSERSMCHQITLAPSSYVFIR